MLITQFVIAGVTAVALVVPRAWAEERIVGTYGEARTTLAFKMPNATAQKLLPEGWLLSPHKDGPAKDANLIVTFMDWLVVQDQDGKPAPTYRNVGLTVPAKQTGTEATVSMVIAGLSSPGGYAPGPYGNFVAATASLAKTSRVDPDGHARAEEAWEFEGESGDSIRLQLQFVRGIADKVSVKSKVHSAVKPEFYRIYRTEQAVDVVRSVPRGTDRIQKYAFKGSGPRLSPLFDGSEQLINVTSLPWVSRRVIVPNSVAR